MRITSLGIAVVLLLAPLASAQTGPDLMIRPWPKGDVLETRGEAAILGQGHVKLSDEDFTLARYSAEGRYRLYPNERADPRLGFEAKYLDIGGHYDVLPGQFSDHSVAFGMGVSDNNGWLAGASIGIGYAGVSPYNDGNGLYGKFDFAIGKTLSENQEIGFVLNYDGNRSVYRDVPLPGFAYRLRLYEQRMLLVVGFPYTSVNYKPDDRWTFEATWSIPDDFRVFVSYRVAPNFNVFARVTDQVDSFFWNDLPNDEDRIFFQQRRAELGLEFEPIEDLRATLAFGYAWDQEFSTGYNASETDLIADTSDEPYLRIGIDWRY